MNKAHRKRIFARCLFDGVSERPLRDVVIESEAGVICAVTPVSQVASGQITGEFDIVTPGLIDLQINGANDVQFNHTPTVDGICRIAEGAEKGGTAFILPTFITDFDRNYETALAAVSDALMQGIPGVLGVHLEGPFLSPQRPGIHDQSAIRRLEESDLDSLCQPFEGAFLLTLAPEEASEGAIARLRDAGITVFAGHSQATETEIIQAVGQGLRGATHLFNAMSQIGPREVGVVGSVLTNSDLFAGIIADGHHVAWSNLAMAAKMMPDRLCIVTDAMLTLAGTITEFDLHGERICLGEGRLQNASGTLAGAHIAMDDSIRNVIDQGIATPGKAVRMATLNPATALGLEDQLGRIRPGHKAVFSTFVRDWQAMKDIRH